MFAGNNLNLDSRDSSTLGLLGFAAGSVFTFRKQLKVLKWLPQNFYVLKMPGTTILQTPVSGTLLK